MKFGAGSITNKFVHYETYLEVLFIIFVQCRRVLKLEPYLGVFQDTDFTFWPPDRLPSLLDKKQKNLLY